MTIKEKIIVRIMTFLRKLNIFARLTQLERDVDSTVSDFKCLANDVDNCYDECKEFDDRFSDLESEKDNYLQQEDLNEIENRLDDIEEDVKNIQARRELKKDSKDEEKKLLIVFEVTKEVKKVYTTRVTAKDIEDAEHIADNKPDMWIQEGDDVVTYKAEEI